MRIVVVALLVAGCGDNIGAVPFSEYSAAARNARCTHLATCGVIPGEIDCGWADIGSFDIPQYMRDSIAFGRIRWLPEVAYECLSHADEWSCDLAVADHWCDEPFYVGTLHDGAACQWDGECISRECWDGGTGTCHETLCPGVCVGDTPPVPGHLYDGCRYSRCLEGRCDGNVCRPTVPAGGTCNDNLECEIGAICAGDTDTHPGACLQLPGTGEQCFGACRLLGDTCPSSTNVCQPFKRPHEPCVQLNECSPFYVCDKTLTCVPRLP